MENLSGKVALVTGGGTGIGRSTSLELAAEGATVAINYSRSKDAAEETAHTVIERGGAAEVFQADVSDDDSVRAMVDSIGTTLGRLDILVNNAGTTRFIPYDRLDELDDEIWDRIYAVNVKGAFYCCRAVAPHMRTRGWGSIVCVSSIAGRTGKGSSIPYAVSKGALSTMVLSLASSMAPEIRVNSVAPGFVETRWTEGQDEYQAGHIAATPLGRIAGPDDVGDAIVSLIRNGFVTGQELVVDGGRTL